MSRLQEEKEIMLGSALRSARMEPGLSLQEIAELIVDNIGEFDSKILSLELQQKLYE